MTAITRLNQSTYAGGERRGEWWAGVQRASAGSLQSFAVALLRVTLRLPRSPRPASASAADRRLGAVAVSTSRYARRRGSAARLASALAVSWLCVLFVSGCGIHRASVNTMTVSNATLTDQVTYLWLGSVRDASKSAFSSDDRQVTLSVRFYPNLTGNTRTFRVLWVAPDGKVHRLDSVGTAPGSNTEFIGSLAIAGHEPATMTGRWRVDLYLRDQLLVRCAFSISSPELPDTAPDATSESDRDPSAHEVCEFDLDPEVAPDTVRSTPVHPGLAISGAPRSFAHARRPSGVVYTG